MTMNRIHKKFGRRALLPRIGAAQLLVCAARLCADTALPQVAPERVGFSAAVLAQLPPLLDSYIEQRRAPGFVVMIARDGQLVYQHSAGFRDLESRRAMTADTLFFIASMTKPVIAAATLQLIERGKLRLDDPVSRYLPELASMPVFEADAQGAPHYRPPRRPLAIRDLLTFTAGLKYGMGRLEAGDVVGQRYRDADLVFNPYDVSRQGSADLPGLIEKLARLPLAADPGERWEYSVAYDVLGRCIEVASGERLDMYLQKNIFDPLDMRDTGFVVATADQPRFATIYNGVTGADTPPRLLVNPLRQRFLSPSTLFSGGGGLVSSAPDYLRFAQMLANGGVLDGVRVLNEASVAQMRSNQLPQAELARAPLAQLSPGFRGYGYGFGVAVLLQPEATDFGGAAGEYFWPGATNTKFWIDPQHHVVGVVFTQVLGGDLPIDRDVKRIVYGALQDRSSPNP